MAAPALPTQTPQLQTAMGLELLKQLQYIGNQIGGADRIEIPLTQWREVAANDIQNLAAHGGILATDSVPGLARVNGATDPQLRIEWAGTEVAEIAASIMLPDDLDPNSPITVQLLAAMAGASDTPVIGVDARLGVGDADAGGNTGAVTGTAIAAYTVEIAAADVPAGPVPLSLSLTPAAHATDALFLYGASVKFNRA